jgi:hypothetical protein
MQRYVIGRNRERGQHLHVLCGFVTGPLEKLLADSLSAARLDSLTAHSSKSI